MSITYLNNQLFHFMSCKQWLFTLTRSNLCRTYQYAKSFKKNLFSMEVKFLVIHQLQKSPYTRNTYYAFTCSLFSTSTASASVKTRNRDRVCFTFGLEVFNEFIPVFIVRTSPLLNLRIIFSTSTSSVNKAAAKVRAACEDFVRTCRSSLNWPRTPKYHPQSSLTALGDQYLTFSHKLIKVRVTKFEKNIWAKWHWQ